MKQLAILFFLMCYFAATAQMLNTEKSDRIVEEGKELYKSEMASWNGTDIFVASYKNHENIGGYFSYSEENKSKCIFFSREENPLVIGTIEFDSTFHESGTVLNMKERDFTVFENDLYQIRQKALNRIEQDTIFKHYENTNLNVIPLIYKGEKKVFVLTGPTIHGVVIFGNDYLLKFDENNEVISAKALHKNIIPIEYNVENPEEAKTMHSHLPETGEYITATDICTIMLYSKYANWTSHHVISEEYLNIWDCQTHTLNILPTDAIRKINSSNDKKLKKAEKKKKKRNKKKN